MFWLLLLLSFQMTYSYTSHIDNHMWLLKIWFYVNISKLVNLVVVAFAYVMTHIVARPITLRLKNNCMHYERCVIEDELMIFIFTRYNLSYKNNISSKLNKWYVTQDDHYYYTIVWQIVHLRFQSVIRLICTYIRSNIINNIHYT